MPRAGFEPTPARFLRPPPLPVGLPRHHYNHAPGRIRTCINATLDRTPLPIGLPKPTRTKWTTEGVEPSFPGCRPGVLPLDDAPNISLHTNLFSSYVFSCRGKGSNLQPRPSESRALIPIELPQLRLASSQIQNGPGRIRTCTNLILSKAPLPIGLLNRNLFHAPGRNRTCIVPLKRRRLCH